MLMWHRTVGLHTCPHVCVFLSILCVWPICYWKLIWIFCSVFFLTKCKSSSYTCHIRPPKQMTHLSPIAKKMQNLHIYGRSCFCDLVKQKLLHLFVKSAKNTCKFCQTILCFFFTFITCFGLIKLCIFFKKWIIIKIVNRFLRNFLKHLHA